MQLMKPKTLAAHVQDHFQKPFWAICNWWARATIYPLVATYAHQFSGERFALLGDAAVGMHLRSRRMAITWACPG